MSGPFMTPLCFTGILPFPAAYVFNTAIPSSLPLCMPPSGHLLLLCMPSSSCPPLTLVCRAQPPIT